jgi:CheY-like chemotaxis protein
MRPPSGQQAAARQRAHSGEAATHNRRRSDGGFSGALEPVRRNSAAELAASTTTRVGGKAPPPPDRSDKPSVIMVVDDNEIDRMVAEGFVSDLGYEVVSAASGVKCLQILHDCLRKEPDSVEPPVHLILLDVLMPHMDGYETLKKLRLEKRLRTIPVIMVTGIDDRANVASFLRAGVDDYVLKPLVLQELQVRLTVCLERRRLQNWVDTLQDADDTVQSNGQLRNTWAFWFDSPESGSGPDTDWDDSTQPLGSFQTIKEFWKVWGALDVKLPEFSHFRLFKQGIKPSWADPANANGGKIIIRAKKSDTSRIWFELILITITQQLMPMEAVNGIVLSIRPNENMVSVWVRSELDKDTPFITRMSDTLRGQLGLKPSAKVFHKYHQDEQRGGSAGSAGRASGSGGSHAKARSLPQTPDYGSDDEGGAMGGLNLGVGFQPDELTQKLMQLASERSGKEVSEAVAIESGRSGSGGSGGTAGRGSGGKRGQSSKSKGPAGQQLLPQMEDDEVEGFESESDHDGPISGGGGSGGSGGDPMAFGRLGGSATGGGGRGGGELRLGGSGSANSTPRSIGAGSEGSALSASSARSSSPSSPLAMEGGTAGSAFSSGTFSSGGGTPKQSHEGGKGGGLHTRAASSPNLSGLSLSDGDETGAVGHKGKGKGKGKVAEPPSPMALASPRSSQGRPVFASASAEVERAARLHAHAPGPQQHSAESAPLTRSAGGGATDPGRLVAEASSNSAVLRARAQRRGRSNSGGGSVASATASEGVAPSLSPAAAVVTAHGVGVGATAATTVAAPAGSTGSAVTATGGGAQGEGLNVTVAFVFCVTLVWLTGLIVYFN